MGYTSPRKANGDFRPGFSGNPAGRPPGVGTVYNTVKQLLMQKAKGDAKGRTNLELVAAEVLEKLLDAEPSALAAIMNREDPLVQKLALDNSYDADTQAWLDALQGADGDAARARVMERATKNVGLPQGAPPPPEEPPNEESER